ncbi:MAG: FHA domain-containing protein [Propionibacteriaceae bacterium]|jgi:hypothetical protein|nr:FHA domain-containing protein [Propionibacteriaceae bacterium]
MSPVSTQPATVQLRVLSYLVDLIVLAGLAALSLFFTRSWVLTAIITLELYVALTLFRARTGRSLGAYLTKTVAVLAGTEHAPGLKAQTIRAALFGLLQLTGVGPLVTLLVSKQGQDWIDRLAGIVVYDLRERQQQPGYALDAYGRLTAAGMAADSRPVEPQPAAAPYRMPQPMPQQAPASQQSTPAQSMAEHAPRTPLPEPISPAAHRAPAPVPAAAQSMPAEPDYELPTPLQPRRGQYDPIPGDTDADADAASARAGSRFAAALPSETGLPLPPALVSVGQPAMGPTAGAGRSRKVVWITFDSGESIPVDRVAVLGREPSLSPGADETPVRVTDSSASISRTHLRVGADTNGIWVEDSYSANGSYLIGDNGRKLLERGRRVYLPSGARLGLGERTLQLTVADM